MANVQGAEALVRAANAAFYEAFETGDLDAMADVWEHSDRVSVTHPGWPTLRGWPRVAGSWDAIFGGTNFIQFLLAEEELTISGDLAWVTLEENILQSVGSREGGEDLAEIQSARIAAVNLFAFDGSRWKLVVHHGSPIAGDPEIGPE